MSRKEIKIEYELKNASKNILWNSIATPQGLSEWFADSVAVTDNKFTFTWDNSTQKANLIDSKINNFVRFQWQEDDSTAYFFEIQIAQLEISGQLAIIVTDFADAKDIDDTILLWNKQIDILRRKTGI